MRSWIVLALAVVLAGASVASAQAPPADTDQDGVVDAADACPGTPVYDLADASGCSVCDCGAESRRDYLRCVIAEVRARRIAGTIGRKAARLVLRAARSSTCGDETLVRCCIAFPGKEAMCKVMVDSRCDEEVLRTAEVDDLDVGSCLPNPCGAE
jgi:hypothetical protein